MVTGCKNLPASSGFPTQHGLVSAAWMSESQALARGVRVLVGIRGWGGLLSLLYFSVVFATVKTGRHQGRC